MDFFFLVVCEVALQDPRSVNLSYLTVSFGILVFLLRWVFFCLGGFKGKSANFGSTKKKRICPSQLVCPL